MVALKLDSQESEGQSTLHLTGEDVHLRPTKNGILIVMSKPEINSRTELKTYVERANSRRAGIQEGEVLAAITVRRPITISRTAELEKRYSFSIISVKMTLGNGSTIMSPFPPDEQWTSALQRLNVNVEVCAMYILVNVRNLEQLQSEHDIYLVDIGPTDIADKYANGRQTRVVPKDIFNYVISDLPRFASKSRRKTQRSLQRIGWK
ncbi:MAG: hypothetical protein HYY22_04355 [Thaumarchaeota archaeon]|nr:hypothetical protein [Nitrososphaerota archaeon]